MSIYRFSSPSLIDEIAFVKTESGGERAYLHAREGAGADELRGVIGQIRKQGWQFIPLSAEGKHGLEVRGFSREGQLIRALSTQHMVEGKPAHESTAKDNLGWWNTLMKRSLQVSGALYLIGDINFIKYGKKEGNTSDVVGGVFYLLGTLALIAFGRNDQADLQVQDYAKSLEQYLIKENVRIPRDSSLHAIADDSHKSLTQQAYDWARSHPAELFNTIYIGAGSCIAIGALRGKVFKTVPGETAKDQFQRRIAGLMDLALGTTTATVSLLGNVIEEKKRDPDDPPPPRFLQNPLAWTWDKIREKPLRLTGYGLMASTMFHAGSTAVEYTRAKRTNDLKTQSALFNRATFVATNMAAEGLVAVSSKGHGEGVVTDESVKDSVYALAAELIVQQPAAQREWHIQHLSGFLQQPNMLATGYDISEQTLRDEVRQLEHNPWVNADASPPAHIALPSGSELPSPAQRLLPSPELHIGAIAGSAAEPQLVQGA